MDLKAYAQISELETIAKANGIEVPRLRGYRLMSLEEKEDISDTLAGIGLKCVEELCTAIPFWRPNPGMWELSDYTDYLRRYFIKNYDGDCPEVNWSRIHGWKRRVLKTMIHNETKKLKKQYDTYNSYIGREDILYIHARIGGCNWKNYYMSVVNQPWFIEKVDDSFDSTYCDIYAKIDPSTINLLKNVEEEENNGSQD